MDETARDKPGLPKRGWDRDWCGISTTGLRHWKICGGPGRKAQEVENKYLFVYLNDFKCSYGSSVFVLDLWFMGCPGGWNRLAIRAQADADHGGFPQKGPVEMCSRLVLVDLWENYGNKAGKIVDSNQRFWKLGVSDLVLSGSLAKSLSKNTLSTNITVSHWSGCTRMNVSRIYYDLQGFNANAQSFFSQEEHQMANMYLNEVYWLHGDATINNDYIRIT